MKFILNITQIVTIIFMYSYFIGLIVAGLYVITIIDIKNEGKSLHPSEQYYFYFSISYIITFIIFSSFAYIFIITMHYFK